MYAESCTKNTWISFLKKLSNSDTICKKCKKWADQRKYFQDQGSTVSRLGETGQTICKAQLHLADEQQHLNYATSEQQVANFSFC